MHLTTARIFIFDNEIHLDAAAGFACSVGDTIEVVRGNGPREGDRMGTATVTGFNDDGGPILDFHLG